jgi:hypothetical protein
MIDILAFRQDNQNVMLMIKFRSSNKLCHNNGTLVILIIDKATLKAIARNKKNRNKNDQAHSPQSG